MHAAPPRPDVFAFDAISTRVDPRGHRKLHRSVLPRDVSRSVFYDDQLEGKCRRADRVRAEDARRSLGGARWDDFLPSEEGGRRDGGEENAGRFDCAVE